MWVDRNPIARSPLLALPSLQLTVLYIQSPKFMSHIFYRHSKDPWVVVLGALWMGHAAYFAQGNSNSLATVDLAAGYIGLKDHVSSIVLPLLCMATYCGPILWFTSVVLFFVRYSTSADRYADFFLYLILLLLLAFQIATFLC